MEDDDDELDRFTRDLLFGGLAPSACSPELWDVPFDGDMGYLGPIAMHSGLKTVTSDRPDDPKAIAHAAGEASGSSDDEQHGPALSTRRTGRRPMQLLDIAAPRVRWTPDLHKKFCDAVSQLGGLRRATPKAVLELMDIPGLQMKHTKSHLQKYRLLEEEEQRQIAAAQQAPDGIQGAVPSLDCDPADDCSPRAGDGATAWRSAETSPRELRAAGLAAQTAMAGPPSRATRSAPRPGAPREQAKRERQTQGRNVDSAQQGGGSAAAPAAAAQPAQASHVMPSWPAGLVQVARQSAPREGTSGEPRQNRVPGPPAAVSSGDRLSVRTAAQQQPPTCAPQQTASLQTAWPTAPDHPANSQSRHISAAHMPASAAALAEPPAKRPRVPDNFLSPDGVPPSATWAPDQHWAPSREQAGRESQPPQHHATDLGSWVPSSSAALFEGVPQSIGGPPTLHAASVAGLGAQGLSMRFGGASGDPPALIPGLSLADNSLEEALRVQIEMQRQLHEQLEAQRVLQAKFEEHNAYLLHLLEAQARANAANAGNKHPSQSASTVAGPPAAGADDVFPAGALSSEPLRADHRNRQFF